MYVQNSVSLTLALSFKVTEFCLPFPTFLIVEDALELSETVLDSEAKIMKMLWNIECNLHRTLDVLHALGHKHRLRYRNLISLHEFILIFKIHVLNYIVNFKEFKL